MPFGRIFDFILTNQDLLLSTLSRGLALSSPLSFCQSFGNIFLHSAESGLFSKVLVDTARILW